MYLMPQLLIPGHATKKKYDSRFYWQRTERAAGVDPATR